jgi:hypothetical protein
MGHMTTFGRSVLPWYNKGSSVVRCALSESAVELFHGSNQEIRKPRLLERQRNLDFGPGFYATTNREQAVEFARKVVRRERVGAPTVSHYHHDACSLTGLRVLRFEAPDRGWLDFVTRNRNSTNESGPLEYDLIIGPVANDDIYAVLLPYFNGVISAEAALVALKVKRLFDRYTFATDKALQTLEHVGTETF